MSQGVLREVLVDSGVDKTSSTGRGWTLESEQLRARTRTIGDDCEIRSALLVQVRKSELDARKLHSGRLLHVPVLRMARARSILCAIQLSIIIIISRLHSLARKLLMAERAVIIRWQVCKRGIRVEVDVERVNKVVLSAAGA